MNKVQAKKLYKIGEEVFKEYYIAHEKEEMIPHLRSLRENWSIVGEQIVHFAINEISTLLNSARQEGEQKKLPEELVEKSTDELYLIWQLINSWWELMKGSWWEREPDDLQMEATSQYWIS